MCIYLLCSRCAEFRVVLPWEDAGGQAVVSIEVCRGGLRWICPASPPSTACCVKDWRPGSEGIPDPGHEYELQNWWLPTLERCPSVEISRSGFE